MKGSAMTTEIPRKSVEVILKDLISEMHCGLPYPHDLSKNAHDGVNEIGDAALEHFYRIDNPIADMREKDGGIEFLELVAYEGDDGDEITEWLWCGSEHCGTFY